MASIGKLAWAGRLNSGVRPHGTDNVAPLVRDPTCLRGRAEIRVDKWHARVSRPSRGFLAPRLDLDVRSLRNFGPSHLPV